jgi:hypothetical protein
VSLYDAAVSEPARSDPAMPVGEEIRAPQITTAASGAGLSFGVPRGFEPLTLASLSRCRIRSAAFAWKRSSLPKPARRSRWTKRGRRRSPFAQLSLSTAQHAPRPGRGDGWPRHPPLRRRRVSFRRERVGSERAARPIARRADNCATPHIGPSVLGPPSLSASGWSRVIFRASPRWRDGSCRGTSTSPT